MAQEFTTKINCAFLTLGRLSHHILTHIYRKQHWVMFYKYIYAHCWLPSIFDLSVFLQPNMTHSLIIYLLVVRSFACLCFRHLFCFYCRNLFFQLVVRQLVYEFCYSTCKFIYVFICVRLMKINYANVNACHYNYKWKYFTFWPCNYKSKLKLMTILARRI